jgi:hypothetical protein
VALNVRIFPATVAGPDRTLNDTGNPELAVAVNVIGLLPRFTGEGSGGKLMLWLALPTEKVAD